MTIVLFISYHFSKNCPVSPLSQKLKKNMLMKVDIKKFEHIK